MDADLYDHLNTTITSENEENTQDDGKDQKNVDRDVKEEEQSTSSTSNSHNPRPRTMSSSLPQEFDQVMHAIQSSPWAARLTSFMGTVRKQVRDTKGCITLIQKGGISFRIYERLSN